MMWPEEIYQRIEGKDWRHIWVVGDIHGCFFNVNEKVT
ncbi:serine/threonine protein phosphatase 1 [Salmonella enterica subsp. arizonae]|uniref:Serine/threonine protein phosphatase 1 n=1 Tax=Salmonella enterica subsp. arizonae TaxID=59203 RepID=A0A3S4G1D4_SALER|nr:serine/threonine protein phosphatase 1 [Salmonella enterica subsp. arizonae]